ncbi:MAG: hypothetical protein ACRCVN_03385 [Spirochaetia bacterium]
MKKINVCFFLIFTLCLIQGSWAQQQTASSNNSAKSSVAVDPRTRVLWSMADGPVRDPKEVLLRSFESGKLPLDNTGLPLLKRIAGAGSYYIDGSPGSLIDIRIRGLSVLGTGGTAGAEAITDLLNTETDPNAMAVAFYSLGEAGAADDPRLIIMSRAMRRDALRLRSNTAAEHYMTAMQKIVPTGSDTKGTIYVLDILSLIVVAGYSDHIRKQAIETINTIVGL